jgi:hypothetical protein
MKFNTSADFYGHIYGENPNVITTAFKYQALYMKIRNIKWP